MKCGWAEEASIPLSMSRSPGFFLHASVGTPRLYQVYFGKYKKIYLKYTKYVMK